MQYNVYSIRDRIKKMPHVNCQNCGKVFYVRPSVITKGFGRFCSKTCSNIVNNPSLSRRVPPEVEKKIIEAYLSGKSKRESGEMFGYGRGATTNILKRNNVSPRTVSQSLKNRTFTEEWKSKIKHNHHDVSGINNPMFGREPGHGKWIFSPSLKRKVRSTWEARIADILETLKIVCEYESHRIYLGDVSYLPDFYLPTFDVYIEVKGWKNQHFKKVLKALKEYRPDIKLLIIDSDLYPKVNSTPGLLLELVKVKKTNCG